MIRALLHLSSVLYVTSILCRIEVVDYVAYASYLAGRNAFVDVYVTFQRGTIVANRVFRGKPVFYAS